MRSNAQTHQEAPPTGNGKLAHYTRILLLLVVFVLSVSIFTRAFFWSPVLKAQHLEAFLFLRAIEGGLGTVLVLGGVGGFLGRAPAVIFALLGKKDLNNSRPAIRDILVCGIGATFGVLLLVVYLSGMRGT